MTERGQRATEVRGDHIDFRGSTFLGPFTAKAEPENAEPSLSVLPSAPAAFTGRDAEVASLLHVLDPDADRGDEAADMIAVAGLGGVGKTALALHVAHAARRHGWFPGGALFIDLRGHDDAPTTADHAALTLLRALGVREAEMPPTADDLYARYRLELASRQPMLIVLDNASGPAQIAPLAPGEGQGHRVLVTSRDVQDSLPVRQFVIDALTPDASCLLIERALRKHNPGDTRVKHEPAATRELAELCGHLPLALLIVTAMLRRRRTRPIATLTTELRKATDRVRALEWDGVDQYRRELALRPVFDVMYARLEPELARVVRLLGQVPEEGIGTASAAHLAGLPEEQLELLLEDLTAASLLGPPGHAGHRRMHDLVHLYIRTVVMTDPDLLIEATEARGRLLKYYYPAALEAKFQIQEPDRASTWFQGGRNHALSWLDSERPGLLAAARWADTDDRMQAKIAMWLALSMDTYLELRHAFDDCATLAEAARDTARRLDAPEAEALACDILGGALTRLRRFDEALDAHDHARDLYLKLEDLDGQAKTWHNVALALSGLRHHDEALEAKEHSLRSYVELGDIRGAATVRTNVGISLDELGRYEEAQAALAQALAEHSAAGNRTGEATTLNSLGLVLLKLGRHDESVTTLRRALGLSAELGEWHLRAKVWNHLGLTLQGLGLHEKAAEAHRRARDWNGFLGDTHTEATAWLNLGGAYLGLGSSEDALDAFQQALKLFEETEDWFYVGGTLNNMAGVYAVTNRPVRAKSACTAAAAAYERAGAAAQAAEARRLAELL
ncbi:tetratricopeptide repeat protein [Streptomyces sp. NPDC046909]|uniref:tetratricopeptide repeat protein n=1 Tax=Streptomyces sp. NPDC046909 TaxID=3155617 RepID=UPI0033D2729C